MTQIRLSNEVQKDLQSLAARDADDWLTLPPSLYCSAELFELEKDRIFRAGWFCIGREDQVADPGDYVSVDFVGEPLLMIRDEHGVFRVLSNVCKHRWMKVCRGRGNAKSLVCPYHAWTYHLDGRLRNAAFMESTPKFDPATVRLTEIRHEIWQGFVYVNLHGRAKALGPSLDYPRRVLQAYKLHEWVVASTIELPDYDWDWKVMQDNGECYHHIGAHLTTFESNYPARRVETEIGDDYSLQFSPARESSWTTAADGQAYAPSYFTPVEGLSLAERTRFVLLHVWPNFFIYVQPDYGMNMRVFPLESGRIRLHADILVPPHAKQLADFDERLSRAIEFFHVFNEEDVLINTQIQRGLKSHYAQSARLSSLELHNRQFARWFANRMLADSPGA